ncbi:MAG: hypothetical protein ACRDHF_17525 [Tepidiformaceae bacterium]
MASFVAAVLSLTGVGTTALVFRESPEPLLTFLVPPIAAAVATAGSRAEQVFDVAVFATVGGWFPFTWWLVATFGGTEQELASIVIVVISYSAGFLIITGPLSWWAATSARAFRPSASP